MQTQGTPERDQKHSTDYNTPCLGNLQNTPARSNLTITVYISRKVCQIQPEKGKTSTGSIQNWSECNAHPICRIQTASSTKIKSPPQHGHKEDKQTPMKSALLLCCALHSSDTELLPKSLQKAKHSPFLKNDRQLLSWKLCSDTPGCCYLAIAESTETCKSISVPTFMLQTISGGLGKVTVPKASRTTMSFSCQLATLRDLLISGAHFFVLSSWYLFLEVNRLLMIQHPLRPLLSLGVDYSWLLKFSLQYYNKVQSRLLAASPRVSITGDELLQNHT